MEDREESNHVELKSVVMCIAACSVQPLAFQHTHTYTHAHSLVVSHLDFCNSIFTTRKRSLPRLCFHRCLFVHGGSLSRRPPLDRDPSRQRPPRDGGTPPHTGMHSCCDLVSQRIRWMNNTNRTFSFYVKFIINLILAA